MNSLMHGYLTELFRSHRLAKVVLSLTLLIMLTPATAAAQPTHTAQTVATPYVFADVVTDCQKGFFGLDPWYKYIGSELNDGSAADNNGKPAPERKCDVKCFNFTSHEEPNKCGQTKSDLPLVLLAVIDDLLRIAGMVTVGFVIYGAFQYVSSQGNPDATSRAQGTIVNALVGLALAIVSVLIVSYIGNTLGA